VFDLGHHNQDVASDLAQVALELKRRADSLSLSPCRPLEKESDHGWRRNRQARGEAGE
jgi:hypothetical protein